MNQTLYDHPSINTTNETFKSVFITNTFSEGCLIVSAEAYDDIGYSEYIITNEGNIY